MLHYFPVVGNDIVQFCNSLPRSCAQGSRRDVLNSKTLDTGAEWRPKTFQSPKLILNWTWKVIRVLPTSLAINTFSRVKSTSYVRSDPLRSNWFSWSMRRQLSLDPLPTRAEVCVTEKDQNWTDNDMETPFAFFGNLCTDFDLVFTSFPPASKEVNIRFWTNFVIGYFIG